MATATDGLRAHGILLGFEPLQHKGACWYYVWNAYAAAGASTGMGSTPTAYKGWQATSGKHPGDRNPPPGAAIWLGRRFSDGNMDGDVFIAGPDANSHAATDQPGWGQTGLTSIQGRINLTGREYLGWSDHVLDCPIILGGGSIAGDQRRVVPHAVANGRAEPTSQSALVGEPLQPNTVGNFVGWINGETVEGNKVWFKGTSGRWFWSGGFTDTGTHDLPDLNPPAAGNVRTVVAAGANGRNDPSTNGPVTQALAPGSSWPFDGWVRGQVIDGNGTWFRGANSGDWFWSGGFTDTGTHDLADLNPPDPGPDPEPGEARTAVAAGVKVRSAPYLNSPQTGFIDAGTSMPMTGWAKSESVASNDVWFLHALGWSWSGGFTDPSTSGIPEVDAPPDPGPGPSEWNPLGLREYPPVYPGAVIGLEAPLGFYDCDVNGTRASRKTKGTPPVPTSGVLSLFIVHWAWPRGDDKRYFSTCNSGNSCPTTYTDANAETGEFIRPGAKPAATGAEWNWRSWAWEVEPITDVDDINVPSVTDAQIDEGIEQMVFLREHHGKTLDGVPVDFLLDSDHVIADRDTRQTDCPGDYLYSKIPYMIEEAQRRYDERHPEPEPEPGPLDPAEYPVLAAMRDELNRAFGSDG